MSPELTPHLARAEQELSDAEFNFQHGRWRVVSVFAYQAAFLAAQALIFEKNRKIVKTHRGLRASYADVVRDRPDLQEWTRWLERAADVRHAGLYGSVEDVEAAQAQILLEKRRRLYASFEKRSTPADQPFQRRL